MRVDHKVFALTVTRLECNSLCVTRSASGALRVDAFTVTYLLQNSTAGNSLTL